MKKLLLAVFATAALALASCTTGAPETETTKCDSVCVDSCAVVTPTAPVAVDTLVTDTVK